MPLIVVVAVHIPVVVAHDPVPGVRIIVLGTTPPAAVVAHIVEETTVVVAVAARKGRKAVIVGAVAIIVPTTCCFQFTAGSSVAMDKMMLSKLFFMALQVARAWGVYPWVLPVIIIDLSRVEQNSF